MQEDRGIELFNTPEKLYGRVVINRAREQTSGAMEQQQSGLSLLRRVLLCRSKLYCFMYD